MARDLRRRQPEHVEGPQKPPGVWPSELLDDRRRAASASALSAWLVEAGFAELRDGKLLATAAGAHVGAYLG